MNTKTIPKLVYLSAYQSLVDKIAEFAYPVTDELDMDFYLDEFFGVSESQMNEQYLSSNEEEVFWEWLWFDIPLLENKTMVETYIIEHEDKLTKGELEYLIGLQKSYRSCFQILGLRKGIGFKIKDLFTNDEFFIREVKGSRLFKVGDFVYARIIPLKHKNVFSGALSLIENITFNDIEKQFNIDHKLSAPFLARREFLKRCSGVLYQILFQ